MVSGVGLPVVLLLLLLVRLMLVLLVMVVVMVVVVVVRRLGFGFRAGREATRVNKLAAGGRGRAGVAKDRERKETGGRGEREKR